MTVPEFVWLGYEILSHSSSRDIFNLIGEDLQIFGVQGLVASGGGIADG